MTKKKETPAPLKKVVDTHINMKPKDLKQGQFFGYYEQLVKDGELVFLSDGRPAPDRTKWVTGQNGPNPLSPEAKILVDQWFANYASGPGAYAKAVLNDFKEFGKDFWLFVTGRLMKTEK